MAKTTCSPGRQRCRWKVMSTAGQLLGRLHWLVPESTFTLQPGFARKRQLALRAAPFLEGALSPKASCSREQLPSSRSFARLLSRGKQILAKVLLFWARLYSDRKIQETWVSPLSIFSTGNPGDLCTLSSQNSWPPGLVFFVVVLLFSLSTHCAPLSSFTFIMRT